MADTQAERALAKVVPIAGCWEWSGWRTPAGYGMFRWDTKTRMTAHRAMYLLFQGPIPDGYEVDHLCRNRACVNPDHLEAVSIATNRARRLVAVGARTTNGRKARCKNGHLFDAETPDGRRRCRTCDREKTRRWRARKGETNR